MRHPSHWSRSRWWRALKALTLTLYTLVFAEIFIRILAPQAIMPRYVTGTEWGVRGNIPNARYWHHTPEVDIGYQINAQGMRADRNYPLAKAPGTCRIALFGDSFLIGFELDLQDTIAADLERRLRSAGWRAEVLNFSVSGFGTAEELRVYERFGRRFDPDVVVFEWHDSDLDDNLRSRLYALRSGRLVPGAQSYLPGVKIQDTLMKSWLYRTLADHSHLYALVREWLALRTKLLLAGVQRSLHRRAVNAEAPDTPLPAADPNRAEVPLAVRLSAALLEHAQALVLSENRDFYVLEVPRRISRSEFKSSIALLPAATRERLRIATPLPSLERHARPDLKLYYEHGQGHFSPLGARLTAEELFATLRTSPRLAACGAPTGNQ